MKIMSNITKIIIISILLLIICFLVILEFINYNDKRQIKAINNQYNSVIITNKDKEIYKKVDNKYKKIGIVSKNTILNLDKPHIKNTSDIYFKIADSSYYIDYLDISKSSNKNIDTSYDNYIATKKITTNPTILYQDNKVIFNIEEEHSFDVLKVDNELYYVKYLDNIYTIKNNYSIKEKYYNYNLKEISILNLNDDVTNSKLIEVLNLLKNNNYNTININDFKLWVTGKVSLPSNVVLLITSNKDLSDTNFIINNNLDDLSFITGDSKVKVGDTTYYKYEIYNTTDINRISDMLKGIKEVKIENQKVAVLNYHFFYDSDTEVCDEIICISNNNFRSQLDYLKKNNFKTLTMAEFNDFMDGKITIPEKSVLITIDDGAAGTFNHLPSILDEYQMHATLFLITGWWDVQRYKSSSYLEIQSHGDELHHSNYCDKFGCGYKSLKLSQDELKEDLLKSISKIGTNLAFCYPFYQTNTNLVNAVKDSGFKLAFVGGNKKASRNSNKYYIPRYIIYKNTSLDRFIKMVNN